MKSCLRFNKRKPKPKQDITSSSLPPNLQKLKKRFLSGTGFVVEDGSLKS